MKVPAVARMRSLLFVPASDPHKVAKARTVGADAVILDLEDAVAPAERPRARAVVASALDDEELPPVFVRVNHPSTGLMVDDLVPSVHPRLFGLVVPKVEGPADIHALDDALATLLPDPGGADDVVVLPLVESCAGLRRSFEIATASPRVVGLAFSSGEDGDFMADLDGEWTPDGLAMAYPRSKLVCETRAAGHVWPVDGVFMAFGDDDALATECTRARALGFQAKMAIHPRQVPIINDAFTPSPEAVAHSRALLAAFERSVQQGHGAFSFDGVMVDKANIARAERILARADARDAPHAGA